MRSVHQSKTCGSRRGSPHRVPQRRVAGTRPRPQPFKHKQRQEKQQAIDGRFADHEHFVSEVMTIEPAPYLKLVAVIHREA